MDDDYLTSMLIALCRRFSDDPLKGRYHVANEAHISEQYIYQIITGKPMQNGQKRSVGKVVRGKLTKSFPDWLNTQHGRSDNSDTQAQSVFAVKEPEAKNINPLARQVFDLAEQINDDGLRELVGFARCLTGTHPRVKAKPALSA